MEEDVNEEEKQQLAAARQATMITLYMTLTLLYDDGLCTVSGWGLVVTNYQGSGCSPSNPE